MKILQLIQKPQNRGAETFSCQLSQHLLHMGHQVKILAVYKGEVILDWEEDIEHLGGSMSNRFVDYRAWKTLAKYIEEFQPDIVQANAGDTLKYAVFSKKIFGWKSPLIFRNASEVGRYLKTGFQKRLNSYFYKNVSGVASVSKASEKDIISHFPFLKGKIKVITVGLEEKIPNDLFLKPKEKKHIIHVGGFSFEKNHKELISIFKKILKVKPETYLHLIGAGKLKPEIEDLVRNERINNKVFFYGFVNNPLDYIYSGDILVLPSIIEGLPGVVLEAMYCKTPVVAYDVGGISEIVQEHTGFLVNKNDKETFAEAVIKILQDRPETKVENANKMVKQSFMNKDIALEFEKFYKELL